MGVTLNDTYQVIAEKIGCSKATVSREIKRNGGRKAYSAVKAQENYQGRRLKSRRPRLLTDLKLRDFVFHCIVQRQWSPEQISGRLVHENSEWHVSYNTIYRGIERDNLGIKRKNHEAHGFARKLRHRGKTRKVKGTIKERRDDLTTSLPFMNDLFHVRIEAGLVIGKVIPFAVKPGVRPGNLGGPQISVFIISAGSQSKRQERHTSDD